MRTLPWQAYDVQSIPTYVVIDRAGIVRSVGHDWQAASEAALKALAAPAGPTTK